MSKRFGKSRVPGCTCTERFTCGSCLSAAPSWHNTPSTLAERQEAQAEYDQQWPSLPELPLP